jgi:ABC-type multidrug transport system fused ATPase/permease subunit
VIILWFYIGPAVFAGLAALVFMFPLSSFLATKFGLTNAIKLKASDSRIKTINEVLNGIKVIKFYGWEKSFANLIHRLRDAELKIFKKSIWIYTLLSFSFSSVTFIVRVLN